MLTKKLLCVTLLLTTLLYAQNDGATADDAGKIALNTYVSEKLMSTLPITAKMALENKIGQLATQNGYGGTGSGRFIITPNVILLTKEATATAPPMTAVTVEVTLYIADMETKTKFSSTSVQLKGVDKVENKAIVEAIKTLNISTPAMKKFVDDGKNKIIEYYNTKCDFILKDAQSLTDQNKYEEALAKLNGVPDVCKACYTKAKDAIAPVYKKYMEKTCSSKLLEARMSFAANPTSMGADQAKVALSMIDPEASCFPKALTLADSIAKKVVQNENKAYDFALKALDASVQRGVILDQLMQKSSVTIRSDPDDWLF
ncbi:MAG: hypothetical protein SFY32_08145 [Bacteroidota bacterium]|nr:hypothetical protein [Bacteroidota bacterium]